MNQMAARIMPPLDIQTPVPLRVAFRTIGCKLNQCETAQMQQSFLAQGCRLVDWDDAADVRVINTCTVTAKSDRTCRHEIRAAKRADPGCLMAVTGCYAEVDPEAVQAIEGVDLVLGNTEKSRLAQQVMRLHRAAAADEGRPGPDGMDGNTVHSGVPSLDEPSDDDVDAGDDGEFITHFYGYTRAFLKVQTGCDSRCAYCIIPVARGAARSMPRDQVVEQVRLLDGRGYREVVLTGINLGSWGRDVGEAGLAELLRALLDHTAVGRIRLSSIEPLEVDDRLLDIIGGAGERVAHHLHLPLQSGTDSVLRRMRRPYTAAEYLEVAGGIRRRFPEAAIGADVIVGFPGETEEEFCETCRFVESSPLTHLHVFAYSDRPGTAASAMTDKVHPDVITARSLRLRALGHTLTERFHGRLEGSSQLALILRERTPAGRLQGLTGNYVEVALDGDDDLLNTFQYGRVRGCADDGRLGFELEAGTATGRRGAADAEPAAARVAGEPR